MSQRDSVMGGATPMDEAWRSGVDAALIGLALSDNPYRVGTDEARSWDQAYRSMELMRASRELLGGVR